MIRVLAFLIMLAAGLAQAQTQTTTLTISGQNNVTLTGLTISTTSGDCIDIVNSSNVTIEASQIGPCGSNNSTNTSKGISITGGGSINIYDSYIHVENLASSCGDSHDGVYVTGANGPITLQGNVIAFNENNVRLLNSSNITASGNFLLNTRGSAACGDPDNLKGHSLQAWADPSNPNSNINASNNYVLDSSDPTFKFPGASSDYMNFGFTNGVVIQNNWIGGDPNHTDQHACGLIGDDSSNNVQILNNVVSNTFNCGIGIASGTNQMVSGNKVLLTPPTTSFAAGISINGGYSPVPCGPVSVSNNIAYAIQSSGWIQSYYDNGYCKPVTLTGNTFDQAAYNILYPIEQTNPPPLIPPQPHSCVAASPYSTQTSTVTCAGGGGGPPPPPNQPPTASLSASLTSVKSGQPVKLSWSSTNATGCTGQGFSTGGTPSGSVTVTLTSTTTYQVVCVGSGGSAAASATVRVHGNPH